MVYNRPIRVLLSDETMSQYMPSDVTLWGFPVQYDRPIMLFHNGYNHWDGVRSNFQDAVEDEEQPPPEQPPSHSEQPPPDQPPLAEEQSPPDQPPPAEEQAPPDQPPPAEIDKNDVMLRIMAARHDIECTLNQFTEVATSATLNGDNNTATQILEKLHALHGQLVTYLTQPKRVLRQRVQENRCP